MIPDTYPISFMSPIAIHQSKFLSITPSDPGNVSHVLHVTNLRQSVQYVSLCVCVCVCMHILQNSDTFYFSTQELYVPSSRSQQPIFLDGFRQCDVVQEICGGQLFSRQRICPMCKYKPLLYFHSYVRLPICSEYWVPHHLLRQRALEGV